MGPVGQNIPRADGPAKVTGDALYVDDIRPAGCLYGATVRAEIAHGKLIGISRDPDFDWTDITVVVASRTSSIARRRVGAVPGTEPTPPGVRAC